MRVISNPETESRRRAGHGRQIPRRIVSVGADPADLVGGVHGDAQPAFLRAAGISS
jgi:hypothetical protein